MQENLKKQPRRRKEPEKIVKVLADKHSKTTRTVQLVISGDKKNDKILDDYLFYKQGENLLLKAVLKAVPFETIN